MCPSTGPRGSVADRDAYQVMGIFCKDAGVDFDGSMCSWEGGQVQEHFAVSMLSRSRVCDTDRVADCRNGLASM